MSGSTRQAITLGAVCALALSTAQAKNIERARGPGYVANALVDAKVDEPLRNAENVFDVYKVIVDWLGTTYPADGDAGKVIAKFKEFVSQYEGTPDAKVGTKGKVRTIEMPMGIDQLMRVLRKEAPGANGPLAEAAKGNAKAQLVTAALLPFLQMRGITYRVRPMIERSFAMHTVAVNALRANRHELSRNGSKNAMAVFEFLTYPMAQKGRNSIQFHTVSELQAWVENEVIPTYDVAIPMAEKALAEMGDSFDSVTLTNFLAGVNPFPNPEIEGADRTYNKADVRGVISSLYTTRAALKGLCAYNLDQLGEAGDKIQNKLMRRYMTEKVSFGKKPRIGSPSKDRYDAIRDFGKLFTIRDPSHGPAALADLKTAWSYAKSSLAGLSGGGANRLVRTDLVRAAQSDISGKLAPQIDAVLAGPATLSDHIGGATVDIDIPGFLTNLPGDLKAFFPSQFDETSPYRVFRFSSGKLIYSNYDFGNPTGWDKSAGWDTLFPNISSDTGPEGGWIGPMRAYRDLSRTYLGAFLAPAIGNVMN